MEVVGLNRFGVVVDLILGVVTGDGVKFSSVRIRSSSSAVLDSCQAGDQKVFSTQKNTEWGK